MNSNVFSGLADWAINLLKIESVWNAVRDLIFDCVNAVEIEELLVDFGYYDDLCVDCGW